MREDLKNILDIQELDVKMIQLMKMKKKRQNEIKEILSLRDEIIEQLNNKKLEINNLNEDCLLHEKRIEEHKERVKKLENQQSSTKKIEEFNALTKEITNTERERTAFEHILLNLVDKKNNEEEIYEKTNQNLQDSNEYNKKLAIEIKENISEINAEGIVLLQQRDDLSKIADPSILRVYDRLLRNKRDRVVVPIENRICTGCHIALTAQHENLVRKGQKLVFCEHCSRIHFWEDGSLESNEESAVVKRRRRRAVTPTQS